jgi:tight adherence protein B
MNLSFALFAVTAFVAVVLCLEGLYNLWASRHSPEARRIAARLDSLAGDPVRRATIERVEQAQRLPRLNALLGQTGPGRELQRWVATSGVKVSATELMVVCLGLGLLGLTLPGMLGKAPILGAALGLVLAALPWWRVAHSRRRRIELIERQFPQALDLMGRAMRAGHAFSAAVRMVAEELPDPLGQDFRVLFDEMNYGVPAQSALARLAERVPLADMGFFAAAVMIQRESGGNLAELLDKIAAIVRERLKLRGEVRTLSAEGRLSAIILTTLPFGVAVVVNMVNPSFMALLWNDPAGVRMVGAALFMMALGVLWMRSIVSIRV